MAANQQQKHYLYGTFAGSLLLIIFHLFLQQLAGMIAFPKHKLYTIMRSNMKIFWIKQPSEPVNPKKPQTANNFEPAYRHAGFEL